jgi:hypothetical protein
MALSAAVGDFLGRGAGACFGAALGQEFGTLIRDPALDVVASSTGLATTAVVARILDAVLVERRRNDGSRRPPIMGGRVASKCLAAAARVFVVEAEDPNETILRFWAEALDAASKSPQAYLAIFGIACEWERMGDAWQGALLTRLWSPARMEGLFVGELVEFLIHLPEDPDACGMSWSDLQLKKDRTALARTVPKDRRRRLLEKMRGRLASVLKGSFREAVLEDPAAREELAVCAALFSVEAVDGVAESTERAIAECRAKLREFEHLV